MEKFLGYTIKPKCNAVQILFDGPEYIEIIKRSHALGLNPTMYLRLLMTPCQSCGLDKMTLDKLSQRGRKANKRTSVHLFVYVNSTINSRLQQTTLKLNYKLSAIFEVDEDSIVYTPVVGHAHRYEGKDGTALIYIFKNDTLISMQTVKIKNSQVYN
jgi:hypothetical protein